MFENLRQACAPLIAYLTGKKDCLLPGAEGRVPLTADILDAARKRVMAYARGDEKTQAQTWGTTTHADGRVEQHTPREGLLNVITSLSVTPMNAFDKIFPRLPWPLIGAELNGMKWEL